ncbi:hypothetical protein PENPOL_c014G02530 [Penicillium polonicum]|uniref:Uncharacterized protein n=1 Tax=Penicillium polonicum TaxID=60169 RepID=A0A1V6NBM5_PENPO|nr:hypothetical protein PENPOL_c014G02530 [Penicillium polonicum]
MIYPSLADIRPIPAPNDEQLELLTQLRLAQIWRNNARREILREARIIRRRAIRIQLEYATNGQPPRAQMLQGLRQWLEVLIHNMQVLRAQEEAAREMEEEIWANVR